MLVFAARFLSGDFMHFYWLVLGILATWRITYFLSFEDGPGNSAVWLRKAIGQGFWASVLDCFYCLSLWIALPLALFLGTTWREQLFLWLALSAGSILLERSTEQRSASLSYQSYLEDNTHDVLWTKEDSAE